MEIAIRNARGETLACADTLEGCIALLIARLEKCEETMDLLRKARAADVAAGAMPRKSWPKVT